MTTIDKLYSVEIGQRFDAKSVQAKINLNLTEASTELIDAIVSAGIYSLAARMKGADADQIQSPTQLEAWASGVTIHKLTEFVKRPSKRGITKSEYSQADRLLDARALLELQSKALRLNRFIPMPATQELDLTELVKNKNAHILAELPLLNVAEEWNKMPAAEMPNEMIRMRNYLKALNNPAF